MDCSQPQGQGVTYLKEMEKIGSGEVLAGVTVAIFGNWVLIFSIFQVDRFSVVKVFIK